MVDKCPSTYVVPHPDTTLMDLYVCELPSGHTEFHMDFAKRKAWGLRVGEENFN